MKDAAHIIARRNLSARLRPKFWRDPASTAKGDEANAAALARTLAYIRFRPGMSVIDFGGGDGASIRPFLNLGCPPSSLASVDIHPKEVAKGLAKYPGVDFRVVEVSKPVPFADGSFDVAFASTVFYELPNDIVRRGIAREMRRVAHTIVVRDWTMWRPGAKPITKERIEAWFGLPVAHIERGSMNQISTRIYSRFYPERYAEAEKTSRWGMRVNVLHATPTALI